MPYSSTASRFVALSVLALTPLLAGCESKKARARADSLHAVTEQQLALTSTLSAQKDSLTRTILEGDDILMRIDSTIRTVKGLPVKKRAKQDIESPIQEQLLRRQELLQRVDALVKRAKTTATELAESRKKEQELRGEVDTLKLKVDADQEMIAELNTKIQEQAATIVTLQGQVDSLVIETKTIGDKYYRAFYIVGSERELLEKGVIEKEGGANLIVARVGRTLSPARGFNPDLFTVIDRREVREIPVPDSARRYALISRQTLDAAEVAERNKSNFRGGLKIADPERFWAPSRYLILVAK